METTSMRKLLPSRAREGEHQAEVLGPITGQHAECHKVHRGICAMRLSRHSLERE